MSSDSAIEAYKKFIECCQKDDSHGWLFICEDSVVKLLSLTALKFAAETGNTIVKERMGDLSEAELVKLQSSMAKLGAESLCSKVKDIDSNESKALWSWCSKILLKIFKLEDPVVSGAGLRLYPQFISDHIPLYVRKRVLRRFERLHI